MSVRETQSRDLTTEGKKKAKVLTYKCYCCENKLEVREGDQCGLCGVGGFKTSHCCVTHHEQRCHITKIELQELDFFGS